MDAIPEWTVADRLRKAREWAHLDQAGLAEKLGAARNTVGNYELGRTRPKPYLIKEWALITGVSRIWIETGKVTGEYLCPTAVSDEWWESALRGWGLVPI